MTTEPFHAMIWCSVCVTLYLKFQLQGTEPKVINTAFYVWAKYTWTHLLYDSPFNPKLGILIVNLKQDLGGLNHALFWFVLKSGYGLKCLVEWNILFFSS